TDGEQRDTGPAGEDEAEPHRVHGRIVPDRRAAFHPLKGEARLPQAMVSSSTSGTVTGASAKRYAAATSAAAASAEAASRAWIVASGAPAPTAAPGRGSVPSPAAWSPGP